MSDGKKHDALKKFKDITGADDERAKFYMESSAWDLDVSTRFKIILTILFFLSKFIIPSAECSHQLPR